MRTNTNSCLHDLNALLDLKVLKVLQPLTSLTFLDLSRCNYVTDDGMQFLASFASLTHLDLSKTLRIGDDSLAHVQGLTELTYLDIGRRLIQVRLQLLGLEKIMHLSRGNRKGLHPYCHKYVHCFILLLVSMA